MELLYIALYCYIMSSREDYKHTVHSLFTFSYLLPLFFPMAAFLCSESAGAVLSVRELSFSTLAFRVPSDMDLLSMFPDNGRSLFQPMIIAAVENVIAGENKKRKICTAIPIDNIVHHGIK